MENILQNRYGISFTINESIEDSNYAPRQDRDQPSRTYLATTDKYPQLTFLVKDGWTYSYGVNGFFGVFDSYTVPSGHRLWDNCKAVAWNTYITPILEQNGIIGYTMNESEQYGGSIRYNEFPYRLQYKNNEQQIIDSIYQLTLQLNRTPIFCDIMPETEQDGNEFLGYCLRVELFMCWDTELFPQEQENYTWIHLYPGYQYSKKEIEEKVHIAVEKLKKDFSEEWQTVLLTITPA